MGDTEHPGVMPDQTYPIGWKRTWPEKPMPGGGLTIPGTYRRDWSPDELTSSSSEPVILTREEADRLMGWTPERETD